MTNREIAPNVRAFLNRASALIGRIEAERFDQEMFCNYSDVGLESPIEDLFWTAVHVLCRAESVDVNPDPELLIEGKPSLPPGLYISPQFKVGQYRVDFRLHYVQFHSKSPADVVVELDGHDFHDKDKRQRSYEKARDRALVRAGFKVLHFTGSDVVADPLKVAHEALSLVGAIFDSEYDPTNPVGLE